METTTAPTAAPGQSGLGIASLILSIVSALAIFLLVVLAGVVESTTPGGMDENSAEAMLIGLLLFAFMGAALLGLGLGIGGLLQQNRAKTLAIVGTVVSAITLVGSVSIILLGLAMG